MLDEHGVNMSGFQSCFIIMLYHLPTNIALFCLKNSNPEKNRHKKTQPLTVGADSGCWR